MFAFAVVLFFARLHTYHEPLECDITAYAVVAHELLAGRQLYSDMWDHKPPAIHVTFALAEAVTGYGPASVFLLNVLAAVVTMLGVFVVVRAATGDRWAGVGAAGFWTVLSGNVDAWANQPNTEVFINGCLIWAFALLILVDSTTRHRRFVLIGGLFALASLYKQVAIVPAALLSLTHLASCLAGRQPWKKPVFQVGVIAAVGLVLWLAVMDYFAMTGRFADFWGAVFSFNRFYSAGLLASLREAVLFPDYLWFTLPLFFLTLLGVLLGGRRARRFWALLLAYLVSVELAALLPGKSFPHYYQLLFPPLVVGAGVGLAILARLKFRYARLLGWTAGAIVLVALLAHEAPRYLLPPAEWSRQKYGETYPAIYQAARRLDAMLEQGESFFEIGNDSGLYFASRRRPPSGVFYSRPATYGPLVPQLTNRMLADLERNEPEVLLVLKKYPVAPFVRAWIDARYMPFPNTIDERLFYTLCKRNGAFARRLAAIPKNSEE